MGKVEINELLHNVDVQTKEATFAMACFWAPDCLFGATKGVIRTRVGYTGGKSPNPTYRKLGDHTEAILIEYDPSTITYDDLLNIYWTSHDPTAAMKRQYTSLIFYHDEEQKEKAEKTLNEQELKLGKKVVTEILSATTFHDAEDYHQKYRLQQHPWLCKKVNLYSGNDFKKSFLAARLNGYVFGQGGINQFNEEVDKLGLDEETANYVRALIFKYEGQGLTC